jgi:hypothetical protein
MTADETPATVAVVVQSSVSIKMGVTGKKPCFEGGMPYIALGRELLVRWDECNRRGHTTYQTVAQLGLIEACRVERAKTQECLGSLEVK